MLSLNTNISDLILQRTLLESTIGLNETINRMTTGLKVNHAKDDAAGFSIIEDLNTRISSMLQVQQNTEDGISLLSTAEGGLEEIQGLLERLRELTIQASTDTYDTKTRASMQAEADAILEEINRLKNTIQYDGMNLYETPSRGNANNPIANLAQSARVSLTSDTGDIISDNTFTLNPVSLMNAEDEQSSSSVSFTGVNVNTSPQPSPQGEGAVARTMMRSASPAAEVIDGGTSGAIAFNRSETKNINIDGTIYEVKNRGNSSDFTWSKSGDTITFIGANYTITGESGKKHDIILNSDYMYYYGSELKDKVVVKGVYSQVYTYAGEDEVTIDAKESVTIETGDDNDTVNIDSGYGHKVYLGNGADVFNLNKAPDSSNIYGESGNDEFNINSTGIGSGYYDGGIGDDVFNVTKTNASAIINGGSDTGTENGLDDTDVVTGSTNLNLVNVKNSNTNLAILSANSTTTLSIDTGINGIIDYEVTNNNSQEIMLIYNVDSSTGKITFNSSDLSSSVRLIIKGDANKTHNVEIKSYMDFYGGKNSDTIVSSGYAVYIYGLDGDDNITVKAQESFIYGGNGNDNILVKNSWCAIYGEDGDDTINLNDNGIYVNSGKGADTINATRGSFSTVYNPEGNDNIENDSGVGVQYLGYGDKDTLSQAFTVAGNSTSEIIIGGKTYTVQNTSSNSADVLYHYDEVTQEITFSATATKYNFTNLKITAASGQEDNVNIYGVCAFYGDDENDIIKTYNRGFAYGGDGDDIITSYYRTTIYGDNGDDEIVLDNNGWQSGSLNGGEGNDSFKILSTSIATTVDGGAGNDVYEINGKTTAINDTSGSNVYELNYSGLTINSGQGDDTFIVNSDNNTINGQGGNDYFEVIGTGNSLLGGTGHTTFIIDEVGNSISAGETSDVIISVPESECTILTPDVITVIDTPTILFTDSNEVTRNINGLDYKFTNLSGDTNNKVTYIINENTGLVTFTSSDVQIDCIDDSIYNFAIRGDNNIVNGGNLGDKITIEQGTNNTINGNSGNDTIINDSENNMIYGGADNDTITLNKTATLLDSGAGDDTINVSSSNNTQILAGTGNDKITVSGSNNTVEAQDGNNTINITGAGNIVNADDGNNKVVINSNDNEVTLGDGDNTFGISGNNNTVASLHTVGNLNINGNENTVVLGNVVQTYAVGGSNAFNGKITVNGNDNVILQEEGNNSVTIKGSGNEYTSNSGTKDITATGNGNTINTTDGDDVLNIKGNSNTYTTTGGNNTLEIKGDSNQVVTGAGEDKVKLTGSSNTVLGGDGNDEFTLVTGSNNTLDGEGGDRNTMINYANTTNFSNVYDITPRPFELKLKVGIGYDDSSVINTSISFNPIFLEVDLSSRESALESLASIDDCLKSVNEQLLSIGAVINRLQLVLDEQSIKLENMISSRSTLRDADLAEESSNYIKYQILQQASSSLISMSRGLRQENVLGLLYGLN